VISRPPSYRNTAAACSQPRKPSFRPLEDRQGLGPGPRAAPNNRATRSPDRSSAASRGRFSAGLQSSKPGSWVPGHDQQTAQQLGSPMARPWDPGSVPRVDRAPKLAAPMPSACPAGSVVQLVRGRRCPADRPCSPRPKPHRGSLIQGTGISTAKTGTGHHSAACSAWLLPLESAPLPHRWGHGIWRLPALSRNPCPMRQLSAWKRRLD